MNTHVEGKFGGVNKFLPFLSFSRSVKFLELDIERIYSLFDWMSHVRGKLREWVLTSPSLFFSFPGNIRLLEPTVRSIVEDTMLYLVKDFFMIIVDRL